MSQEADLRQQLARMLNWGEAHTDFQAAVADFPVDLRGVVPPGMPHSAWQLLEHLRIAAWDIVEFTRDARHKSPPWPKGYWSVTVEPPQLEAWDQSVQAYLDHLEEMRDMLADRKRPLLEPLPRGQGQNLLREVLLLADHHAYHLGQLVLVRKALGIQPK